MKKRKKGYFEKNKQLNKDTQIKTANTNIWLEFITIKCPTPPFP